MNPVSSEERVQLVLRAFKNSQYKTENAASLAFDVPETTLRRLKGDPLAQFQPGGLTLH